MSNKNVVIFDFDHTIIEDNSDVILQNVVRDRKVFKLLYNNFKNVHSQWTKLMGDVFEQLHKENFSENDFRTIVNSMKFTVGMPELISELQKSNTEMYIVSDSNTWIIETFLKENNIRDFSGAFDKIISNPAKFVDGKLCIEPYHNPHQNFCSTCPLNLCKGHVVSNLFKNKKIDINSNLIAYIGDGSNDYCGCCRIIEGGATSSDIQYLVFPRANYSLAKYSKKIENHGIKTYLWRNGTDILNKLKEYYK